MVFHYIDNHPLSPYLVFLNLFLSYYHYTLKDIALFLNLIQYHYFLNELYYLLIFS